MAQDRPWFPMYHGDWRRDSKLRMCSASTRGVWIEIICALEERNEGPSLTATVTQLARLTGCTEVEIDAALAEMEANDVAEISRPNRDPEISGSVTCHALVTVTSRRMSRREKSTVSARERKRLERSRRACHAPGHKEVTTPLQRAEGRGQKEEIRKDTNNDVGIRGESEGGEPSLPGMEAFVGAGSAAGVGNGKAARWRGAIEDVWQHYAEKALPKMYAILGRGRPNTRRATPAIDKAITTALQAGYLPDELKTALDNACNDAWLMGLRDRSSPQLDIPTLLKIRPGGSDPMDRIGQLLLKTTPDSGFGDEHRMRRTKWEREHAPARAAQPSTPPAEPQRPLTAQERIANFIPDPEEPEAMDGLVS